MILPVLKVQPPTWRLFKALFSSLPIPAIPLVLITLVIITTEGTFTSSVDLDLVGSLTVKANSIEISDTINADTVTFEVPNFVNDFTNASTVSSDSLNFILTDDFTYSSTTFSGFNNFSNLAITTDGTFTNNDTIAPTGNLAITANSFDNSGGVVSADTFSLSVALVPL